MRFTISTGDKKSSDGAEEEQAYVINEAQATPEVGIAKNSTRMYLVILSVTVLFLVTILAGLYMFRVTATEKEIKQFSMQLGNDMKQDVTNNPNTNTVMYHVQEKDQDVLVLNDYNAYVTVMKIRTAAQTNCFITPLSEKNPVNLQEMQSGSTPSTKANTERFVYKTSGDPIPDISFLSKTSQDTCKGVSTYWLYTQCDPDTTPSNLTVPSSGGSVQNGVCCCDNGQCYSCNYYAYCGCYSNNFHFSMGKFKYTCVYKPALKVFIFTLISSESTVYYCTKRC